MSDDIRLSEDDFRRIYEFGFTSWAALAGRSNAASSNDCVTDALLHQPPFPANLRLSSKHGNAYATGTSHWTGGSACDLAAFTADVQIQVSSKEPIVLSRPAPVDDGLDSLFPLGEQSYVAVLVLAWAYILSARWAEVMPGPCCVEYTDSSAPYADDVLEGAITINLGDASPEETRWWAGVLARGRGSQAALVLGDKTFLSPWTIDLRPAQDFAISGDFAVSELQGPAPSFTLANEYLQRFCARRDILDQSRAALAAVLLLPCFAGSPKLRLPAVRVCHQPREGANAPRLDPQAFENTHQITSIDKCLVLSCNMRGIRQTLLSPLYEPSIECNAVTPWLQGSLAAIQSLAGRDRHMLWLMMASRSPTAAWLWLGAIVLGVEETLFHQVLSGLMPIDLTSSAWSGTVQSFMQAPNSRSGGIESPVPRADECRLLFLAQAQHHTRFPISRWKPFGSTPLPDTHIEVCKHVNCQDHTLRYQAFSWDCVDGQTLWPPRETRASAQTEGCADLTSQSVSYSNMDRGHEGASENATRSIFGWLRFDGHARHEKAIWGHQWFALYSADDDDTEQETNSTDRAPEYTEICSWLSDSRADDGALVEH